VLEEVQVPPGLGFAVVDGAAVPRALGAREARALGEVDAQLKPALLKRTVGHAPRSGQPERLLEEVDISHPPIVADTASPHTG
jgi:hypothetical protein